MVQSPKLRLCVQSPGRTELTHVSFYEVYTYHGTPAPLNKNLKETYITSTIRKVIKTFNRTNTTLLQQRPLSWHEWRVLLILAVQEAEARLQT